MDTWVQQYDQLLALTKKRRTIRQWSDKPVSDEIIYKLFEPVRWTPSAANAQPWDFIVVRDAKKRIKLGEFIENKLKVARREYEEYPFSDVTHLEKAPVHIIVVGNPLFNRIYPTRREYHFQATMGMVPLALVLAATSLGLGAVTATDVDEERTAQLLGIPKELKVMCLVAIGYPAHIPDPTPRREVRQMLHWEEYDVAKFRGEQAVEQLLRELLASKKSSAGKNL